MLAAMIVEEGRVLVATSQKKTEFAHALRRLANPRLDKEAFLANAKVVLEAIGGTDLARGLFNGLPPFEGLFVHSRASVLCRRGHVRTSRRLQNRCGD